MIKLKSTNLAKTKISALVVPVCEDGPLHDNPVVSLLAEKALAIQEFKGAVGDRVVLYSPEGLKIERVVCLGLGKMKKVDGEALRSMAGKAVKLGISRKLPSLMIAAPSAGLMGREPEQVLGPLMEGACLGNHRFDRYKEKVEKKPLGRIDLLVAADQVRKHGPLQRRVQAICDGAILAREWVSTPANDKRPELFAKEIADRGREAGLKVEVITERGLTSRGFGAMMAVGQGSDSKPRLVVLRHMPKGAKKTIALVGKGVTFDSGGINLKPTAGLTDMKMDMSGAAAVAGTLISAAKIKPKVGLVGLIPIVENMPSGNATRPGDIIKSFSGKTVEIGNTDAEGRLILADAMAYAVKKYKPHTLIDLATLTGACVVALGEKIAGVFSSDDDLARAIVAAGRQTHERCWHLPLPEDYKEMLKSPLADLSNMSSSRWGGAITAALFLSEFAGKTPWAHIDIAGPAYTKKATDYCEAGGTGFGVRLLWDLVEQL